MVASFPAAETTVTFARPLFEGRRRNPPGLLAQKRPHWGQLDYSSPRRRSPERRRYRIRAFSSSSIEGPPSIAALAGRPLGCSIIPCVQRTRRRVHKRFHRFTPDGSCGVTSVVICFKNRIRGTVVKFEAAKAPWQGEKPNVDAHFPR